MTSLSIIMPVYNEQRTIALAIERVLEVNFPCAVELIVVDDGSTDLTPEYLAAYASRGVTVVTMEKNSGKGAAVARGVALAQGSHMIILDADLEYSPADIPRMLEQVMAGRANHIYGARVFGMNARFTSFKFAVGGRATTFAANAIFDSCMTDMHTCLKLIPTADFRAMTFRETGFGLDTEMTAKLLRAGVRPFEVPISYHGRSASEGKKITWRDGFSCLRILMGQRLRRAVELPVGTALPDLQAILPQNTLAHDNWDTDGVVADGPVRAV
jgi:dolichol-phosphate hexosyltransferase